MRIRVLEIQFHDVNEFVAEVLHDRDEVDRNAVRVTQGTRRTASQVTHMLSVSASCVIDGYLVRFDRDVGELWGEGFKGDPDVREVAASTVAAIRDPLEQAGPDVRAGSVNISQGVAR